MVNYENNVREFHASLRKFYYHHLFEAPEFSPTSFKQLPQFSPKIRKTQKTLMKTSWVKSTLALSIATFLNAPANAKH